MAEIRLIVTLFVCVIVFVGLPSFAIEKGKPDIQIVQEQKVYANKISYDEVLKKAKAHSYDLKIADYNVLISGQGIRGARSEYFPKLNFMAGTEYTSVNDALANGTDTDKQTLMAYFNDLNNNAWN